MELLNLHFFSAFFSFKTRKNHHIAFLCSRETLLFLFLSEFVYSQSIHVFKNKEYTDASKFDKSRNMKKKKKKNFGAQDCVTRKHKKTSS